MGRFTICWAVAVLILGADAFLPVSYKCGVQPKSRDNCGEDGITADECVKKGCCFDDSQPDSIWCYTPWKFEATECNPTEPKAEVNCGYPGISEKDAQTKDAASTPRSPSRVERDCGAIEVHKRANCGPPDVSPDKCKQNGCCFDSSVAGVPWCFKPLVKKETIQCAVLPKQRVNCGFSGINMDQCYQKGCCFDSNDPDAPWCFYPDITDVTIIE
ncbi:hypothetical protein GDO81_021326 [Engystomops pustulosus]|uniref:P-type domain-containing protein n=1 Tax=Engystomops pustulosus TaxID=76066 RepID=A0AAV6ZCS1_ENGPU|nr:hypothetical protein GDO81_021326 [Engystomops pustulosus]